jgi:hypothetical protein
MIKTAKSKIDVGVLFGACFVENGLSPRFLLLSVVYDEG